MYSILSLIHKLWKTSFSATEYHLGLLKAKLAKYRSQLLEPTGKAGAKGEGFDVMKSGDARVALIGLCLDQSFIIIPFRVILT